MGRGMRLAGGGEQVRKNLVFKTCVLLICSFHYTCNLVKFAHVMQDRS